MDLSSEITPRSPLEKPLGELTEEDISQLTREDCRRFLKDRGMRRPSWNKSQAIQQVISLKALLEDRSDPATAGIHQKPPMSSIKLPEVSVPSTRTEGGCSDLPAPAPAKERVVSPYRREPVMPVIAAAGDEQCRFQVAGRDLIPPESICPSPRVSSEAPADQLTIFYGGRVTVYNGVAADKARVIMQLAASPGFDDLSPELFAPARVAPGCLGPFPIPTTTTAGRPMSSYRESAQEWRALRETEPEVPTSREVSLQRYLEKRKDRFKGKRILGASSLSNRDMMFFSQKFRAQTGNEQSSPSEMSSPTHPRPPCTPTRCSSMENKASKLRISVDLNEDGGDN